MRLYYAGLAKDADAFDIFYQSTFQMSYAEKIIETWKLTETMIQLQQRDPNELRLDRTTLIIRKI